MLGVAMLAMGALVLCSTPLFAAQNTPLMLSQPRPILNHPVAFGAGHITTGQAPQIFSLHLAEPVRRIAKPHVGPTMDPVLQRTGNQSNEFNPVYNVMGVGNGFPGYSVPDAPPDTTMAVGDTEVVQWVNVSYADFNKATGAIIPINGQDYTPGNYIWQTLLPGTACANNNDGDIIVKFDRDAHRWIMAQNVFTGNFAVCVAISQTSTFSNNTWYAYEFPVVNNGFPDYPKWGVWSSGGQSDGYYQNWNNFGVGGSGFVGPVACGYDRAKMLTGDPSAEQICFQLSNSAPNYQDSLLPGDRDSPTPPPANQDEFFVGSWGDIDTSHLSAYSMHIVDWAAGQATMTGNGDTQLIQIASYTPACNGGYGGDCVPQKGVNDRLDSLGDRLMYRFAYWDDTAMPNATSTPPLPAHVQHWYVNVDVTNPSTGANAVRWMEFNAPKRLVPATALSVFQQGTYAGNPGDSQWRWMGSLTRDNVDDVLLGYSESSSTMYPSIAVAGRQYTDPVGTLSPEQFAVNGTGSQTDTADRWGDYSTMAIDPTDNCTFFYTTEYYMVTATFDWSTNISSWKFPSCQ
jgi:hypothetical protein